MTCYLLKPRDPAQDRNFFQVEERGIDVLLAGEDEGWNELTRLVGQADIILDALLSTGTRLPLRGALAEILEVIGKSIAARRQTVHKKLTSLTAPAHGEDREEEIHVVAVDGPTGLDYDSGALDERAISADLTVTFAHPKAGHFRFPGAGALGEMVVADIGTDPALAADVALRAQGLDAFESAAAGAYLHGLAGELARREKGTAGMVAGDSLTYLPQAWQHIVSS